MPRGVKFEIDEGERPRHRRGVFTTDPHQPHENAADFSCVKGVVERLVRLRAWRGELLRLLQIELPRMVTVLLNGRSGSNHLPWPIPEGARNLSDRSFVMRIEGAQLFAQQMQLVLHEQGWPRIVERAIADARGTPAAVIGPLPIPPLMSSWATLPVRIEEACPMLRTQHVDAPEEIGKPLVLPDARHLVDC